MSDMQTQLTKVLSEVMTDEKEQVKFEMAAM